MGIGVPDHHLGFAMTLLREKQFNEAKTAVNTALALAQLPAGWVDPAFDSIAKPANEDMRRAAIETFDASVAEGTVAPYVAMTVWQLLGETDRAMQIALQAAAADGAIYELEIVFIDEFASFRRHPNFLDLLGSLGISRHWANIGCMWTDDRLVCDEG
jgi:hypothetical protein